MRALIGVLASLALLLNLTSPAAASCAAPASVAENADRAVAVVYGTVTTTGGGALTLRVDRVLKGNVGGSVTAFLGPGRGGAGGTAVATSVDYAVKVGSDHVLYLIRGDDGRLETNACIGSHAGPPTAAEVAYFGAGPSADPAGTPPRQGSGTTPPEIVPGGATPSAQVDPIWPALIVVIVGTVLVFVLGRRALGHGRI